MAAQPTDRLGKFGRRTYVGIFSDDSLADDLDVALAALKSAGERADSERIRTIQAAAASQGDLEAATQRADAARAERLAPLEAEVDRAQDALDKATLWYQFRSIGRTAWYALIKDHPATDEDNVAAQAEGAQSAAWHTETMIPALLVAASTTAPGFQPVLTAASVAEMMASPEWNEHEIAALFVRAVAAQTQARLADESKRPR